MKPSRPVGDDNGLFILPVKNRIWIPNSGVPAKDVAGQGDWKCKWQRLGSTRRAL